MKRGIMRRDISDLKGLRWDMGIFTNLSFVCHWIQIGHQVLHCWADGGFEIFKRVHSRFFLAFLQPLFVRTALMYSCSQINIHQNPRRKESAASNLDWVRLNFSSIEFAWLRWVYGIDHYKWHRPFTKGKIASPTLHQGVWILTNWHQPLHQLL